MAGLKLVGRRWEGNEENGKGKKRAMWSEQGGRDVESEGMLVAVRQAPRGPGRRQTVLCWSGSGGFLEEGVSQAWGGPAELPWMSLDRSWAEEEPKGQSLKKWKAPGAVWKVG